MTAAGEAGARGDLAARLRLVCVTPDSGTEDGVARLCASALKGGATALWVRERSRSGDVVRRLLAGVMAEADARGALVLVAGDVDACAAGLAHGVHLGFRDATPAAARRRLPPGAVLGISAHDPVDPEVARDADYATLSPLFATPSKHGRLEPLGVRRFAALRATLPIPVVALGGIDAQGARAAVRSGASGVAVLRAWTDAADPEDAVRRLRAAVEEALA